MAIPLKTQNQPYLWALTAAQLLVFYLVFLGRPISQDFEFVNRIGDEFWYIVGLFGTLVTVVLTEILPLKWRTAIVHWKLKNPLPGYSAFTEHLETDSRIDIGKLNQLFGDLPTEPAAQNRLFYKILKWVEDTSSVSQSHGRFLLLRDMSILTLISALVLSLVALAITWDFKLTIIYFIILLTLYLVVTFAAQHAAVRFLHNVLAVASTKDKYP